MNREKEFLVTMEAFARFQQSISDMLEYKAVESEKTVEWVHNHYHGLKFPSFEARITEPLKMHEQLIEVIDGVAKMEAALGRNLKVLLPESEDNSMMGSFGSFGSFGSWGGFGDSDGDEGL